MPTPIRPLSDIRVLDFTNLPPGSSAAVMLADLGAEVVRVEPPKGKGKPSTVFGQVAMSRARKSICVDWRRPEGVELLGKLIAGFDVVLENALPGAMEERGFGYAQAKALNPGLIWCSITGFGQSGPYAQHAGHDLSYVAHSGLLDALAAGLPWHPGQSLAVQAGGLVAVIAVQGALALRQKTGEGAFVDTSLTEAAGWLMTCLINPLSESLYRLSPTPDRRLYACSDGRFVAVASAEPRTWKALCDGLDLPQLEGALHDPARAEECEAALAQAFARRTAQEWVDLLAPAGAAVAPVNSASDFLNDPHAIARGSYANCDGTNIPANPVRISTVADGKPITLLQPAVTVGQNTAEVLAAAGLSPAEIGQLEADGIV